MVQRIERELLMLKRVSSEHKETYTNTMELIRRDVGNAQQTQIHELKKAVETTQEAVQAFAQRYSDSCNQDAAIQDTCSRVDELERCVTGLGQQLTTAEAALEDVRQELRAQQMQHVVQEETIRASIAETMTSLNSVRIESIQAAQDTLVQTAASMGREMQETAQTAVEVALRASGLIPGADLSQDIAALSADVQLMRAKIDTQTAHEEHALNSYNELKQQVQELSKDRLSPLTNSSFSALEGKPNPKTGSAEADGSEVKLLANKGSQGSDMPTLDNWLGALERPALGAHLNSLVLRLEANETTCKKTAQDVADLRSYMMQDLRKHCSKTEELHSLFQQSQFRLTETQGMVKQKLQLVEDKQLEPRITLLTTRVEAAETQSRSAATEAAVLRSRLTALEKLSKLNSSSSCSQGYRRTMSSCSTVTQIEHEADLQVANQSSSPTASLTLSPARLPSVRSFDSLPDNQHGNLQRSLSKALRRKTTRSQSPGESISAGNHELIDSLKGLTSAIRHALDQEDLKSSGSTCRNALSHVTQDAKPVEHKELSASAAPRQAEHSRERHIDGNCSLSPPVLPVQRISSGCTRGTVQASSPAVVARHVSMADGDRACAQEVRPPSTKQSPVLRPRGIGSPEPVVCPRGLGSPEPCPEPRPIISSTLSNPGSRLRFTQPSASGISFGGQECRPSAADYPRVSRATVPCIRKVQSGVCARVVSGGSALYRPRSPQER